MPDVLSELQSDGITENQLDLSAAISACEQTTERKQHTLLGNMWEIGVVASFMETFTDVLNAFCSRLRLFFFSYYSLHPLPAELHMCRKTCLLLQQRHAACCPDMLPVVAAPLCLLLQPSSDLLRHNLLCFLLQVNVAFQKLVSISSCEQFSKRALLFYSTQILASLLVAMVSGHGNSPWPLAVALGHGSWPWSLAMAMAMATRVQRVWPGVGELHVPPP